MDATNFSIPDPKCFENCKMVFVYDPDKKSRRDREKREILIRAIIASLPKLVVRINNEYSFPEEWKYQELLELNPNADPFSAKDIENRMHKRDNMNTLHGLKYFSDNYHFKNEEIGNKIAGSHKYGSDVEQLTVYLDTRKTNAPKLFNDNRLLDELLKRPLHWFVVCSGREVPDMFLNDSCLMLFENFSDFNHHLITTRKIYDPKEVIYTSEKTKEESSKYAPEKVNHFDHLEILRKQPAEYIYIDKVSNMNSDCKWIMNLIDF